MNLKKRKTVLPLSFINCRLFCSTQRLPAARTPHGQLPNALRKERRQTARFLRLWSGNCSCTHVIADKNDVLSRVRTQYIRNRVDLHIAQDDKGYILSPSSRLARPQPKFGWLAFGAKTYPWCADRSFEFPPPIFRVRARWRLSRRETDFASDCRRAHLRPILRFSWSSLLLRIEQNNWCLWIEHSFHEKQRSVRWLSEKLVRQDESTSSKGFG